MKYLGNHFIVAFSLLLGIFTLTSCDKEGGVLEPISPSTSTGVTNTSTAKKISCRINEDLTLENHTEGIDYIVDCDVRVHAFLTVEPGVTIVFKSNTSMVIESNGGINASGNSTEPIEFIGEETIKGFWKGIALFSSDVRNRLAHVHLSDAGSNPIVTSFYNYKTGIVLLNGTTNGKLGIENSTISNCDGYGFVAENETTISYCEANTFQNNSNAAIRTGANNVKRIDSNDFSSYTGNGFDGIQIRQSTLNEPVAFTHTWKKNLYHIDGDIKVKKSLTIRSGSTLLFEPSSVMIIEKEGRLKAIGNSTQRIVFKGMVDGNSSWRGIVIRSSYSNQLLYSDIMYGGSDPADPT